MKILNYLVDLFIGKEQPAPKTENKVYIDCKNLFSNSQKDFYDTVVDYSYFEEQLLLENSLNA